MSCWSVLTGKAATAAVLLAAAVLSTPTAPAAAATASVHAYPAPGTSAASPSTGISLRGVTAAGLGTLGVVGSVSGLHPGAVVAHRDGHGVTFTPEVPFTPGETVTVRSRARVAGSRAGVFTFTVARPGRHPGVLLSEDERAPTGAETPAGSADAAALAGTPTFRTRPDLRSPGVNVTIPPAGTAPGLVLSTPYGGNGHAGGPMIFDNAGHLVWFRPTILVPGDLKVVRFGGQDVLTWFEGAAPYGPGTYRGLWPMVDQHYATVATVRAGNGYQADLHDIAVTPAGTAYLIIYNPVIKDLTSIGGPRDALVLEVVVQEVDIVSGAVLFEWHSFDHVPLTDSFIPPTAFFDYMHGNSLDVDTDGNLLLGARNTSTVYKIDRSSGAVLWQLGGKHNQFRFVNDPAGGFNFQHDARRASDGTLSLFDNGNFHQPPYSRAVRYALDLANHTATLIQQIRHSPDLFAPTQGRNQELPGGHRFVSWGGLGVATEYTATGSAVFEAAFSDTGSYRMVRQVWHGRPSEPPAVLAVPGSPGVVTVYASWNGATDVAGWQVLAGPDATHLHPVAASPRTNFETAIPVRSTENVVQVRAVDANGAVVGTSPVVPGGHWFTETRPGSVQGTYKPLVGNFGGTASDDIFWYAPGAGPESLWLSDGNGGFQLPLAMPPVNGTYTPLVANFVGDEREEILWRAPGSTAGYLWRFDAASPQSALVPVPAVVSRPLILRHNARLGGAAHAEMLWYAVGSAPDRVDRYLWPSGGAASVVSRPISVTGTYTPVTGDFDANGWADVMWYSPGSAPDFVWLGSGDAATGSTGQRSLQTSVSGDYVPMVGRYGRAVDERDDLLWYAPGPANDYLWESAGDGTFRSVSATNASTGAPVRLQGARDYVLLWPGGDGTIWTPSPYGMQLRPAGNTPLPPGYLPVVGEFTGTGGVSSIFWYAPGSSPELLFRPVLA